MPFDPIQFKKEAHEFISNTNLQHITAPHIESFNALLQVPFDLDLNSSVPHYKLPQDNVLVKDSLLNRAIADLGKCAVQDPNGNIFEYFISSYQWDSCRVPLKLIKASDKRIFPNECRTRHTTYKGTFKITLQSSFNGEQLNPIILDLGQVPIMTRSSLCHLSDMDPQNLVRHHEDPNEMGGTFIVNGNEKLIRLLIATRRNHPFALNRSSFKKRGPLYSELAVMIRSVRADQTSLTNYLHYLTNGSCVFRFHYNKAEYLVPVALLLKALTGKSDLQIFKDISTGSNSNDNIEQLLRDLNQYPAIHYNDYLSLLGERFRTVMNISFNVSDVDAGLTMIQKCVLVHLYDKTDKYNMLILMIRKCYALSNGLITCDDMDATSNHEVLLGGHLYNAIIKEQLEGVLSSIRLILLKQIKNEVPFTISLFNKILSKPIVNVGNKLEYFLATGNLISKSGLDLLAMSGYTIMAEKLNFYRYLAHFKCIHRGQVFMDSKSTSMRKLKPESFGFICCVHTPDGAPCGLLTHLTHNCKIVNYDTSAGRINEIKNAVSLFNPSPTINTDLHPVCLEGQILGYCSDNELHRLSIYLRTKLNNYCEIGYIPFTVNGQFPGLYLFTGMARFVRPVEYLYASSSNDSIQWIGSFEQVYLDILCVPNTDIELYLSNNKLTTKPTHVECSPTSMLSIIANMTPYSDYNQSPRNMYQCQMGKQTMGTFALNKANRTDNKSYLLNCGQSPIVRPSLYDSYQLDDYPNGTNAVVAVISYTSYDMEDAMIINKQSHERGIGNSTIYKSEFIDLHDMFKSESVNYCFGFTTPTDKKSGIDKTIAGAGIIDRDGLPFINATITFNSPFVGYINTVTKEQFTIKYKGMEDAIIDTVRLTSDYAVNITYRINRPTITGDKWSSRHGQKGVNSLLYPTVDLPFTESGIQPDIIINPNAFPSRMTIGMFVESMAGKAGALNGKFVDATPFQQYEELGDGGIPVVDKFGHELRKHGYNYYGNEQMYSGITGELLDADIYIGVVYYQRLRHMVSDKYQVRTHGPVDRLTKQPIKGRKRSGGIRFGEMERDSLLAHGTSFMLQDRLLNCSDYCESHYCTACGTFLNIYVNDGKMKCMTCNDDENLVMISMPFVLKYFTSELASMNIKLTFKVRQALK